MSTSSVDEFNDLDDDDILNIVSQREELVDSPAGRSNDRRPHKRRRLNGVNADGDDSGSDIRATVGGLLSPRRTRSVGYDRTDLTVPWNQDAGSMSQNA